MLIPGKCITDDNDDDSNNNNFIYIAKAYKAFWQAKQKEDTQKAK